MAATRFTLTVKILKTPVPTTTGNQNKYNKHTHYNIWEENMHDPINSYM